jgi:hypothetical protein
VKKWHALRLGIAVLIGGAGHVVVTRLLGLPDYRLAWPFAAILLGADVVIVSQRRERHSVGFVLTDRTLRWKSPLRSGRIRLKDVRSIPARGGGRLMMVVESDWGDTIRVPWGPGAVEFLDEVARRCYGVSVKWPRPRCRVRSGLTPPR